MQLRLKDKRTLCLDRKKKKNAKLFSPVLCESAVAGDAEHRGLDELHGELIRRDGVHTILWEERKKKIYSKRSSHYTIHTIQDCIT